VKFSAVGILLYRAGVRKGVTRLMVLFFFSFRNCSANALRYSFTQLGKLIPT